MNREYNLSQKPKIILDSLLENGEEKWLPVTTLIQNTWGPEACSNLDTEKKWRRNLSCQLNHVKEKIGPQLIIERNRSLDAIRLVRNIPLIDLSNCAGCTKAFKYLGAASDQVKKYCIDCLCKMMDVCPACECDPCDCNWGN